MPYKVVYRHYHENSIGEQGNGPLIEGRMFDTQEEARAEALRLDERHNGRDGSAYWTSASIVTVPDGSSGGKDSGC